MNTVGVASPRLYATTIGAYIFTVIAMYFLNDAFRKSALLSDHFFIDAPNANIPDIDAVSNSCFKFTRSESHRRNINDDDGVNLSLNLHVSDRKVRPLSPRRPALHRYTAMIRSLPLKLAIDGALNSLMREMFGDEILRVIVVPDVTHLLRIERDIETHKTALESIAKAHSVSLDDLWETPSQNLPDLRASLRSSFCCRLRRSMRYHKAQYDALCAELSNLQSSPSSLSATPSAFVIFASLRSATNFVQSTPSFKWRRAQCQWRVLRVRFIGRIYDIRPRIRVCECAERL